MPAPNSLPPEVVAALQRGNLIEAVKLLRKTFDLSLKDAKAAIDHRSRGVAQPPRNSNAASPVQLPIEALQALRRGNAIEAIGIVHKKTGIGLMEAKDTVDAYRRRHPDPRHGLSPGEVPPQRNEIWIILAVALVAFIAWQVFL
jgi:ribosomal protein L7/L12